MDFNKQVLEYLKTMTDGKPYGYGVAEGDIKDHEVFFKTGYNPALSSAYEDMWAVGGLYVPPTAGMGMEVVSSSADDTDTTGTGVRTVRIQYLDSNFNEKSEIVALSGATPVPTVATDIYRIQSFRAVTAGTGATSAGNIDVRHLSDTPIYARIATGNTRSKTLFYTVPASKVLYISSITAGAGANAANKVVRYTARATYDVNAKLARSFFVDYTELILVDNSTFEPITFPIKFPSGTDIKVSGISPDGAAYGVVTLRGWLEKE